MRKWKCSICDYVHEGDNPPGECPHCESIAEVFTDLSYEEQKQREKNTQENGKGS